MVQLSFVFLPFHFNGGINKLLDVAHCLSNTVTKNVSVMKHTFQFSFIINRVVVSCGQLFRPWFWNEIMKFAMELRYFVVVLLVLCIVICVHPSTQQADQEEDPGREYMIVPYKSVYIFIVSRLKMISLKILCCRNKIIYVKRTWAFVTSRIFFKVKVSPTKDT